MTSIVHLDTQNQHREDTESSCHPLNNFTAIVQREMLVRQRWKYMSIEKFANWKGLITPVEIPIMGQDVACADSTRTL